MLHLIKSASDSFFSLVQEDPVRPTIPYADRVGDNKDIFVLVDDGDKAKAITCVSYQAAIPTSESELFRVDTIPDTAIFYTIWSYAPGAGRNLIFEAVEYIKTTYPSIKRFVTLSPKTEMAKRFHIKNCAITFRENQETVNYEYLEDRE